LRLAKPPEANSWRFLAQEAGGKVAAKTFSTAAADAIIVDKS
jgi:hypothetical protein